MSKWQDIENDRKPFDRKWTKEFEGLIYGQITEVARVAESESPEYAINNLELLMSYDEGAPYLRRLVNEVGYFFAQREATRARSQVKSGVFTFSGVERKEFDETVWSSEVQMYINSYVATKIVSITDTTRDWIESTIRDIVRTGMDEGLGSREIARMVRNKMLESRAEYAFWRAERIARTEVMAASNYGSISAAEAFSTRGRKEWISGNDGRTRATHRPGAVATVPIPQPFRVGYALLKAPGVPFQGAGGPDVVSEIVNCRCAVGFDYR